MWRRPRRAAAAAPPERSLLPRPRPRIMEPPRDMPRPNGAAAAAAAVEEAAAEEAAEEEEEEEVAVGRGCHRCSSS